MLKGNDRKALSLLLLIASVSVIFTGSMNEYETVFSKPSLFKAARMLRLYWVIHSEYKWKYNTHTHTHKHKHTQIAGMPHAVKNIPPCDWIGCGKKLWKRLV